MRMNKNLFQIICVVLILIGWATGLIYFTQPETESESEFFKEVSIENLQEEVKDVASELLMLKHSKQQCKDNLTEYQTLAEYKGIEFYCSMNDARIEQLKNILAAMLTMPYEQLDSNLNEAKQDKEIEHLSWVVASGSWSLQALMDFLQAE